ncbi:unnamed protein product [Linum trigynum]|uniref:Uncharacterized protein n=1 Tax=Linum trigynum TaxID=586398 RepID=A0AAV2F4M6_9ROSI
MMASLAELRVKLERRAARRRATCNQPEASSEDSLLSATTDQPSYEAKTEPPIELVPATNHQGKCSTPLEPMEREAPSKKKIAEETEQTSASSFEAMVGEQSLAALTAASNLELEEVKSGAIAIPWTIPIEGWKFRKKKKKQRRKLLRDETPSEKEKDVAAPKSPSAPLVFNSPPIMESVEKGKSSGLSMPTPHRLANCSPRN